MAGTTLLYEKKSINGLSESIINLLSGAKPILVTPTPTTIVPNALVYRHPYIP